MSNTHQVYFMRPIGADGPVKIGCSKLPRNRLEDLARWSADALEIVVTIPGGFDLEHNLHDCFADSHIRFEWFAASAKLTKLIDDLKAGVPVDVAIDLSDRQRRVIRKPPVVSADARLRMSYRRRIREVENRLRENGEATPWHMPDDVGLIMDAWADAKHRVIPSKAQFARLDAYLADPSSHSIEAPVFLQRKDRAA